VPVLVERNADLRVGRVVPVSARQAGSAAAAANLVRVPAGKEVAAFYIDRYEYPNRLGARPLCGKTRQVGKQAWSWEVADAMARAAGKRLPTRAQWVAAAEGPRELLYPYGAEYLPGAAALGMAFRDGPLPAGSRPQDRSFCGVYDLSGNVSEWIAADRTEYPEDPGELLPELDADDIQLACGGNWTSGSKEHGQCRYVREYLQEEEATEVGFRCVLAAGGKRALDDQPAVAPGPRRRPQSPGRYAFKEVYVPRCPKGMVIIRPRKGTAAYNLVPYAFCIDVYEYPGKPEAKPWRGSWFEAFDLARKAGKRLPTRAEWQVACGGAELVRYPFGDAWELGERKPAALGYSADHPGAPFACRSFEEQHEERPGHWGRPIFHLVGNVSEWVLDMYQKQPELRGVVGGCWFSRPERVGTAQWEGRNPAKRGIEGGATGFRCVARLGSPEGVPPVKEPVPDPR
jgi:formylglycine-generating enzyme required for sulfatase activity